MNLTDLSTEQQELIALVKQGKNILVDACIGSGKTTTIQALCNELPDLDILYLTYNRLLKVDAKEKIKNRNVMVTNYNGFAFWCLARAGVRCGLSDQFQVFNKTMPEIPRSFDLLVIDEYQDIESEMVPLLNHIKDSNPGLQIVAVGDMAQKIYDKTVLDVPSFMAEFLGEHEKLSFTRCFRLSKDIAAKFGRIWEKPIIGVNDNCAVDWVSEKQALEFLADKDPKDILCLGSRTGAMSRVLNRLEKKYPEKYNKSTIFASISQDRGTVEPTKDVGIFTTYDSSKGMERKYCVVFDYNEEYFATRLGMPNTDAQILKNIFCVAGSRGKEKILFVSSPGKYPLSEETLTQARSKRPSYNKPFQASSMFDFKYKEDIEECYKILDVKRIQEPTRKFKVLSQDEMIDLSPCFGIFLEASYFHDYDIDKDISLAETVSDMKAWYRTNDPAKRTVQEKILSLVALETRYSRYIKQCNLPFITSNYEVAMHDRLAERLSQDEMVQTDCSIIAESDYYGEITINGRCDVERADCIYELKFVEELQHEHFLQLATYLVAKDKPVGYLWNVKNNEIFEIKKPDDDEFIKMVVKCITKGTVQRCRIVAKSYGEMRNLDNFKRERKSA